MFADPLRRLKTWLHVAQSLAMMEHEPQTMGSVDSAKISRVTSNLFSIGMVTIICSVLLANFACTSQAMSLQEKASLREEVRDMFHHGYGSYMYYAYPADELMPLSCKGRYRGVDKSRGDIDDALGNFSLTLVDTLDTLALLGENKEFLKAVQMVIDNVKFDADFTVSVFETNIRVLGGLLGAHTMMEVLQEQNDPKLMDISTLSSYKNELLTMSMDLGDRLLKAFDTETGLPYSRVNLKYGLNPLARRNTATCTACAGTILLEFGALSRFTGVEKYETAARRAMNALWARRAFSTDLVGETINVTNGRWTRADSGIGAGIDSYYEYLLKAYIMLDDRDYLDMFQRHYDSIMQRLRRGPFVFTANMQNPTVVSRRHLDSLQTFWPGLQVLYGDIKHAVEMHRMHYQMTQRHVFMPEAYTTDGKVHWGNWPLRPEFIESTYFLYRATRNPFYLEVGKSMINAIQNYTSVGCGFAAIHDVRKMSHEDKMDSFFLAETVKYLYLLFTEPEDLAFDVDKFVFTTEAHFLPVALSQKIRKQEDIVSPPPLQKHPNKRIRRRSTCPGVNIAKQDRRVFLNMVSAQRPKTTRYQLVWNNPQPMTMRKSTKRSRAELRFSASELDVTNPQHVEYLSLIGIMVQQGADGIKLIHQPHIVDKVAAAEGLQFMQEIIRISQTTQTAGEPLGSATITFTHPDIIAGEKIVAGLASFGVDLEKHNTIFRGRVSRAVPSHACSELDNALELAGTVVLVKRGECMFVDKARIIERAGALAMVVMDNNKEAPADGTKLFTMSGDGIDDIGIPSVFVWYNDGLKISEYSTGFDNFQITIAASSNTMPQN